MVQRGCLFGFTGGPRRKGEYLELYTFAPPSDAARGGCIQPCVMNDGIAHAPHTVGRISRWRCSDGFVLTTRILQCPSHFPNRVCLDVRKDSEPNKSISQEIMNQLHHRQCWYLTERCKVSRNISRMELEVRRNGIRNAFELLADRPCRQTV